MSIENESAFVEPTSPADKAKINGAIDEIVGSMVRKAGEQDHIKEIKKMLKEEFNMPPKLVQRLAKTAFEANLEQQRQNDESFYEIYTHLRGKNDTQDDDYEEGDDE